MRRVSRRGVGLIFTLIISLIVCSCSVTRCITSQQTHTKNGDTTAVMTTRMVETYTATKQNPINL